MGLPKASFAGFAAACALIVLSGAPARADDTEIFAGNPTSAAAPNILFILDTSGSMGANVTTTLPYDPKQVYAGNGECANIGDRVYWSLDGRPPSCDSNWFPREQLKCADALRANTLGPGGSGVYIGRFIRWGGAGKTRAWQAQLNPKNATEVECRADSGVDGNFSAGNPYPSNQSSSSAAGVWTGSAKDSYWRTAPGLAATLFSGNYVTWWRQHRTGTIDTRLSVMKKAATDLLNSLSGVNVGLMRYDSMGSGGMVAYPVSPIESSRAALISAVNSYDAGGATPLSETLFEAYRYFSGGPVLYGNRSSPFPSVAASRNPRQANAANYDSPADDSCQKNYVVYLTDGLPTSDNEADSLIAQLPDFATLGGACDATGSNPSSPDSGRCLVALSRYMHRADLRPDVIGMQNVSSFWIGFGTDVAAGAPFKHLERAAQAGGGRAYTAEDADGLRAVLTRIVTEIMQTSATFSAPAVAVNAFNRTRSQSDLYVSVFQPVPQRRWPGNLKKYRIKTAQDGAVVVGVDPRLPAIDPASGFFVDAAQSFWSESPDGPSVQEGGAANQLPEPSERKLYTYLGANPPSSVNLASDLVHALAQDNATLTGELLGIDSANPDDPARAQLIQWLRGQDVLDEHPWKDGPNGDTAERRRAMGDPVHTQPALVIYGGSVQQPDVEDAVAFVQTNDGFLHAVDAKTGKELWSFIPKEVLADLKHLFLNTPTAQKNYLLDGEIQVLKYDVNGDGIVTAANGDRVFLFFGRGRGGGEYYALDVTNKTEPRFMWTLGPEQLPGVGQAWSTPVIARVDIDGARQNSQKLALIIGGGYDGIENNYNYVNADTAGNRIYIIDALRGTLLWSAGPSGADFNHSRMTHSIPGGITVLDTDSDGYVDRMYAGDMAAQVWRFDIANGKSASELVTGGVIASLGSREEATRTASNTRRFYNAPDVAAIQRPSAAPYLNIAIGSGYRGHPLDMTARDRFYSLRDYRPFRSMAQAEYDALPILRDADLVDITTDMTPAIPASAPGWKLHLNQPGGAWRGEKVLGKAVTVNNAIVFTTYTPGSGPHPQEPCAPAPGVNRAYAVSVFDGSPARIEGAADPTDRHKIDPTDRHQIDPTDRYQEFMFGGIAPDISTMILDPEPEPCEGGNCDPAPQSAQFVCVAGVTVLDICRTFDSRVKTYWRDDGAR